MTGTRNAPEAPRRMEDFPTARHGWSWTGASGSRVAADPEATARSVEYIGRTALVVTGPYTGARYRFGQPGAQLTVDARDCPAMLSIPMLRAVTN